MERATDRAAWAAIGVLMAVMFVFVGIRLVVDVPNVISGTVLDADDFSARYAAYPWLAYAHILSGVIYLSLAPFQLWRGFRDRNQDRHRRIGRVALVAGSVSGVFAIVFGVFLSFGGTLQATASVLFGSWFLLSLGLAYRAIRRREIGTHRRWMIRAFAVGLAVGTIRLWIGLFEGFGLLDFRDAFGVAFWISFLLHAAAAEAWLWWRPGVSGALRVAR